jgi:hypothetical protein
MGLFGFFFTYFFKPELVYFSFSIIDNPNMSALTLLHIFIAVSPSSIIISEGAGPD